jgi:hypothetical protein
VGLRGAAACCRGCVAQACNEAGAPFDVVGESDDCALDTLRANEEPACSEAADAREAYFACVAS